MFEKLLLKLLFVFLCLQEATDVFESSYAIR